VSAFIYYGSRQGAFSPVNLGEQAVRLGAFSVQMAASMGDVGTSNVPIDDPTGTAGHSSDQIKGYHTVEIIEGDCAAGNRVLLSSITGERTYESADSLNTGAAVRINTTLQDCNRITQFQLFRGSVSFVRPAETVGARLTALIANAATPFVDSGLVVYPTTLMDANDYNGQTASSVLDDCAEAVGYNWFIYKRNESSSSYSLWFDDPNISTADSSSLRISNVLADIDSTVSGGVGATQTWGPLAEPSLTRTPQNLASGVLMPWSGGTYFGFRGATRDIYGDASITAADNNVKSLAAATLRVNRLLWQDSTEEDSITVSLNLPRANVNDVREGQRMQAKFRQLPGYKSSYTWFRVVYRTVSQVALTDEFYTVSLTLSPQEAAQPVGTIVQSAFTYGGAGGATISLPNPITIGNKLVVCENRWKGNGNDPISPYIGSGGIGGTNAWTPEGFVNTAASGDRSHVGMWTKIATATTQSGPIYSAFTWMAIYEVANTTGSSVISATQQNGSVMDIGSLGTAPSGSVAIMIEAQYTPDVGLMTLTPVSPWLEDARYVAIYWSSQRPYWQGHALGTGSAIEAKVTSSVSYPWCGMAILLTP